MTAEQINLLLKSEIVGRPVRVYQEVTSTNDLAMQLGDDDAPEGCAIFAERQISGRGRLGRRWQSQPGDSLACSILLRPRWPEISRIGLAVAVVVARVVQKLTTHRVGIKWPNDIYLGGKKIGGILCEAGRNHVAVGIGLNVLQSTSDFSEDLADRAGSIVMFADRPVDRIVVAASLLNEMDRVYASLPESFAEIIAECELRSVLLKQVIEVELDGGRVSGIVEGLDDGGRLKIRKATGEEILLSAGEVTVTRF